MTLTQAQEREFYIYKHALELVRDRKNQVCEDFELCTHAACQSSCEAFFIALAALDGKLEEYERSANQGQEGSPAEGRRRLEPPRQQVREAGGEPGDATVVVRGDRGEAVTLRTRLIHCDELVLHSPGTCIYCDEHGALLQSERIQKAVAYTDQMPLTEGVLLLPCPAWQKRGANCQVWGGNRPRTDVS